MPPRIFIIGDIHGCCKTFQHLVLEQINIRQSDKIYCLGDYIDRGPDSKGVVDFIMQLRAKGYHIHTLRGNHEQMLLDALDDECMEEIWLKNGGGRALESFGVATIYHLPPEYLQFFNRTKLYIQTKHFLLVHAGVNFSKPNPLSDKEDLLWIRNFEVDEHFLNGRLLIHGHTPITRDQLLAQPWQSPFNLDGGCVFTDFDDFGSLYALNFLDRQVMEVRNME